ncbi:MAG: signal peptidase I [Luteibaculaceae bacterium]
MAKRKAVAKKNSGLKAWLVPLLVAYLIIIGVKTVIGFPLSVSNASMLYTLKSGDIVWVNKFAYGIRLPSTLLSLQPFGNLYLPWISLPYKRVFANANPEPLDVVLFNFPYQPETPFDKRPLIMKRVVAVPGDIFLINAAKIFVNDKELEMPDTFAMSYLVKFKEKPKDSFFTELGILEGAPFTGKNTFELQLTKGQLERIKLEPIFLKAEPYILTPDVHGSDSYPGLSLFPWNKDFFGPFRLPQVGDTLFFNRQDYFLYRRLIEEELGSPVETNQEGFIINGVPKPFYIFQQNYYFMLGDNFSNSSDSRHWGPISEKFIVGKVMKVLQ